MAAGGGAWRGWAGPGRGVVEGPLSFFRSARVPELKRLGLPGLEPLLSEELGKGRSHWTPSPAIPTFPVFLEVIGVAELVNKINGPWFSKFDEDLATAFSIYCGISIAHVRERDQGGESAFLLPTSVLFALVCPSTMHKAQIPVSGVLCSLQYMLAASAGSA